MNLASILTYALTSVFALEQSIPQKGLGVTKKEIVMNGIHALLKAAAIETGMLAGAGSNVGTNTAIQAATTLAGEFIDSSVASLNKAGAFRKVDAA